MFDYGINTFFIFFQAFISAIFSSYLLKAAIQKILENERFDRKFINKKNEYKSIKITIVYCLIALILIFIASRNGVMDYKAYLNHWTIINQGLDPWTGTDNVYLPIHNVFAPLASINNSLPKIVFVFIFAIPMYLSSIFPLNFKREMDIFSKIKIFAVFAFSPFCILITSYYGLNDTPVAGLIVLSLYLSLSNHKKQNSLLSGISLALATMIKVYPIFIAPLFIFRKKRIDITFFTSYFLSIIGIFFSSIIIWGKSTLKPFLWATEMHSKHLSFFNFFRRIVGINFDEFSVYAMAIVLFIALVILIKNKIDLLPSVILTLALGFTFYKIGHPQYFLFFFAVSPMTIRYIYDKNLKSNGSLFISFLMWICFLNFYQTFYTLACHMFHGFPNYLRGLGSLPYLLLSIFMLNELFKLFKKDPKALSSKSICS
tara:strand:- start:918 stop:2204 length:1287 start_codon:yes stop_codon:yes gene_type:complete